MQDAQRANKHTKKRPFFDDPEIQGQLRAAEEDIERRSGYGVVTIRLLREGKDTVHVEYGLKEGDQF